LTSKIDPQLLAEALRNCEREPIHQIGSIQPTGVLLTFGDKDLQVRQASENAAQLFGMPPERMIGQSLPDLLGRAEVQKLLEPLGLEEWRASAVVSMNVPEHGQRDAMVFRSGGLMVVEFELQPYDTSNLFRTLFIPIRDALWRLDAESNLATYTQTVVDQVRLLTGYDRVMMYRFASNWDGEVISESAIPGVDSYLGNRFPASDIPPQARELYTRNLVRVIGDVNAVPVPVRPALNPLTKAPLDLSYSSLRTLSPVHLEYLRNMGVAASLTISLIQNGRLWGLIACHHFTPKYMPLRVRELDEFIGKTVSLKLSNLENDERLTLDSRLRELLNDLTWQIRQSPDIDHDIHECGDELLSIVRAQGAVVALQGTRYTLGDTPNETQVDGLLAWLRTLPVAPVFSVDNLPEVYPQAAAFSEIASGLMIAPLDHELRSFILWFRIGITRTINWAGRAEKYLIQEDDQVRMSPRKSFVSWVETYQDKCPPWSQVETDAGNALSMAAIEVLSQRALRSSEENYRLLAEHSTDMIARLDLTGICRFASPSSRALLDIDAAAMSGRPLAEFIVDEDRDTLNLALAQAKNSTAHTTSMLRFRRFDGKVIWVECSMRTMWVPGKDAEIVVNARDVTQRYSYQLAIEDLHRRNTMILEAAGEGVVSLDREGQIVFANDRAARILGLEPDMMIGQLCCEVLAIDDGHGSAIGEQACPFLNTIRERKQYQSADATFQRTNGRRVSVEYVSTPLIDQGQVSGCVVVFNESQERNRISEQLSTTDVILAQAVEAVMVTDAQGVIVSVNRAFIEITGYAEEEAIGQTPRLLKSGIHTQNFYRTLWEKIRVDGRWAGEIWNRRKNGEVYPQWGTISVILDAKGTIQNYVAVFSDISKAKQTEEKLFYLANHDPLTGLPNRMRFSEQLTRSIERAKRQKSRLAVAFIDLDRFKIVNDTLGHSAGDIYLQNIATRLSHAIRQDDFLARWGGDEFILTLEDITDHASLTELIQRIVGCISDPIFVQGHDLDPTASIGLAIYPDDALVGADLIKAADTAMYKAKDGGRNRFQFYSERLSDQVSLRFNLGSELRRALRHGEFLLHYQPQVDASSRQLVGLEALIRWQHPTRGLIMPLAFIGVAEELGLLDDLGGWVINEVCRQYREWLDRGLTAPPIAINVAPVQLHANLIKKLQVCITTFDIPAGALEVEITEGAMEQGEVARDIMRSLRKLGVSLAVDDFGTGYSSLSHLKTFPLNCLKIDKSFVDGLPDSVEDTAIVRTILALGSSLGMEVLAEGVETQAQFDLLRDCGVDVIQGYYFAKPLPEAQLSELMFAYLDRPWPIAAD
jgi:diguanylate cyclase (GGDEF)-like protein/PAS domain S-box-containing protein